MDAKVDDDCRTPPDPTIKELLELVGKHLPTPGEGVFAQLGKLGKVEVTVFPEEGFPLTFEFVRAADDRFYFRRVTLEERS